MANAIIQVQHRGSANGQLVLNTSYWQPHPDQVDPLPLSHVQGICANLASLHETWFCPLFHISYSLIETTAREVLGWGLGVTPPGGSGIRKKLLFGSFSRVIGTALGVGSAPGDAMPNTVAAVCHWDTGRVGRRRRGRWKLSPYTEADNTGNQMTTALRSNILSAAEAYRAPQLVGTPIVQYDMVVFSVTSLFETAAPGAPGQHCADVTGQTIAFTWGVQRSRKFNSVPG